MVCTSWIHGDVGRPVGFRRFVWTSEKEQMSEGAREAALLSSVAYLCTETECPLWRNGALKVVFWSD